MINRREFFAGSAAFYLSSKLAFGAADDSQVVNDIHSQLNRTRVDRILRPKSVKELQATVLTAKSAKKPLSIAAGRHAMGGQQFGTDMILVHITGLDQIISFDQQRGLVEVQAGAFWPEFTTAYLQRQQGASQQWGFAHYLTYHRFARREQVLACYPDFAEFLKLKKKYDPSSRFQSDWYRHYQAMFGEVV